MSNDNPDTERRTRPEGEPLIETKRSASHAALQAGALGSKGNDSKSNDSKTDQG